jgi:hypothetical protein
MRTARCILIFLLLGVVMNIAFTIWLSTRYTFSTFSWPSESWRSDPTYYVFDEYPDVGLADDVRAIIVKRGPAPFGYSYYKVVPSDGDGSLRSDLETVVRRHNAELVSYEYQVPLRVLQLANCCKFVSSGDIKFEGMHCIDLGWPFRTASYTVWQRSVAAAGQGYELVDGKPYRLRPTIDLSPKEPHIIWGGCHILPTIPIWKGIILNSLFWSAIFASFFHGLHHLRHRHRIRRGRCPRCAYPMGTSPACTECGTALPASAVNTTHS